MSDWGQIKFVEGFNDMCRNNGAPYRIGLIKKPFERLKKEGFTRKLNLFEKLKICYTLLFNSFHIEKEDNSKRRSLGN